MDCYVGLDIGGTKIMVKSVTSNHEEIASFKLATPIDLQAGLTLLNELIAKVSKGYTIKGIGAAIGEPLDAKTGVVSPLHQPNWRNVPLKQIIEAKWQAPFYVDVDTNVAAVAEYYLGQHKYPRFLYVTLSTGMGGGYLIDGKIYQGLSHPEVAHQSISHCYDKKTDIYCECGAPDCLEALVSGNGIKRIYNKPAEELLANEWQEVAYNLGQGLRNIATILSPQVIVFGGGVAIWSGLKFIKEAQKSMCKHLKLVVPPKLVLFNLGYDTALEGAICFAKGLHLTGVN